MMVRLAVPSDLPEIAHLLRTSFEDDVRPYMTYAQQGVERFLGVFVSRPAAYPERTYLVTRDDSGRVVGYAEFQDLEPGLSFLSYICVSADMRRQGVGSAMLGHFLGSRSTSGRLQLEVFADNSPAVAAYRKAGFVAVDGGRTWIRRPIPAAAADIRSGELRLSGLALSEAMHLAYGFSELPAQWRGREVRLGRIGPAVLRCFTRDAFDDDELLFAVRRILPELTEAFLVSAPRAAEDPTPDASIVARTIRMERGFAASPRKVTG